MASVLHGSARTTPRIRAELQASKESARSLAARYDLNPKTVPEVAPADHDGRCADGTEGSEEHGVDDGRGSHRGGVPPEDAVADLPSAGLPEGYHSHSFSGGRSTVASCGMGSFQTPKDEPDKRIPVIKATSRLVHIDSCELRHADGKLVMFLAIDRVSKFTYVEFHDSAGKKEGAAFLRNVVAAFPYKIHTVLTDNGMAFADPPKNRQGPSRRFLGPHIFDRVCIEHGIEHRLTKPYHPWTNGQAERMNRTIKDATVKVFHYEDLESLKAHVLAFVTAYNFAKHLKALRWRTPYQAICNAWTNDSAAFKINPPHLIPGPYT